MSFVLLDGFINYGGGVSPNVLAAMVWHGMTWHGVAWAWQDLFGGEGVLVKMATAATEPIRIRTEVSRGFPFPLFEVS